MVGETIRAIMDQRGLSQTAIAKFVGVTQAAVSRWCAGLDVPTGTNLSRLAAGLGVHPSFLLSYDGRHIAELTRAVQPGEFMAEPESAAVRHAEQAAREVADVRRREVAEKKEATRLREASRQQEAEERQAVRKLLRAEAVREDRNWRARVAIAGNRCMICAAPLPHPGFCAACASGHRDEE